MSISEQVKNLRLSAVYKENSLKALLNEAADTIESLSAKLQAADMERTADGKMVDGNKLLKDLEKEVFVADLYEHGWDGQTVDNLLCLGDVKKVIENQVDCGGGWIYCGDGENLPEENKEVICCFKSGIVEALVLYNCKFHGKVYTYEKSDIIAWHPLPEPYHEP